LVKLNAHDHTPQEGVTPPLVAKYAGWLDELGIDGVEVSCGSPLYSYMNMCRGTVPVDELVQGLAWWQRPLGKMVMGRLVGKYDLQEGYNLEAAKVIRAAAKGVPLLVVGGFRRTAHMNDVLENGYADFVSMSRPLLREPRLVKRIREGRTDAAKCASCNKCLAAAAIDMPVRCYAGGFPE
jgi:2,4-dienoyl-CoA reductase-like NADH-dependent reductase (Old Yellow Enzyme family)